MELSGPGQLLIGRNFIALPISTFAVCCVVSLFLFHVGGLADSKQPSVSFRFSSLKKQCHVLHGSRNGLNWPGKRMKTGTRRGSRGQVVWALCQRSLSTPESQCASDIELVEKQVYYMQRNKEVGYYILIRKETMSMIYPWVQKRQVQLFSVGAATVAEESLRHKYLGGESYGGHFLCIHQHQHP